MGKNKYRFKGHESFILREGWLNKGLYEVDRNPKVFSENYGADALGVGPNMAKAIRYWLRAAELVTDSPKTGVMLGNWQRHGIYFLMKFLMRNLKNSSYMMRWRHYSVI